MPNPLCIRIYFDNHHVGAYDRFKDVASALSDADASLGMLFSTTVYEGQFEFLHSHRAKQCTDDVIKMLRRFSHRPGLRFDTESSVPIWRFDNDTHETYLEQCILEIDAWDATWSSVVFGDVDIEGLASIAIWPANPFWAAVKDGEEAACREYNERVAENLERAFGMMVAIADSLRPSAIRVFVDEGTMIPLNSHCTYFRDEGQVISDLRFLHRLWVDGHAKYHVPPLRQEYQRSTHRFALSCLRPEEMQLELWQDLHNLMPLIDRVTEQTVRDALQVTPCDVHRVEQGFFVCYRPYYLNHFAGDFYLDVLEVAGTPL